MKKLLFSFLLVLLMLPKDITAQTATCGSGSTGTACGTSGYTYGTLKGSWNISTTTTYALNGWYVITYTAAAEQCRFDFTVLAGQVVDFATISGQDVELNITPQGNTNSLWVFDNDVETSFTSYPTPNANDETGSYVFPTSGVYSVKVTANGCANLTAGTKYLVFRTRYIPCAVTPAYGAGVWNGYVYDGTDLNYLYGGLGTQSAASIAANWTTSQPFAAVGCGNMCDADNFSTRWLMNNTFTKAYYVFSTPGNDDGRRLSADGGSTWIFNDWTATAGTTTTTKLLSGNLNMVFDQRENTGGAAAYLTTCQMAGDYTFGTYPTWNAYVFDNQSIADNDYQGTLTTTGSGTTLINQSFGTGQPTMVGQRCGKTMDNDYFNVRYLSTKSYTNGVYVFTGNNDDGRRLYVDGGTTPLFDNWGSSSGSTLSNPVLLNGSTNLVYDMYEMTGGAAANLSECQMNGGDLTAYGSGTWNVYAYNSSNYNFLTSDYRGFFTSGTATATAASFSLTDATVGSSRTGACGTAISADPSMRALLTNTFTKGVYTAVAGNDDVYRLSVDGGSTWSISGTCCGNTTASVALNGSTSVVYQGYDTGGGGTFNASLTVLSPVAGTLTGTLGCPNTTLSWTGGVGFYTWQSSTDINFGTFTTIGTETNTVANATSTQSVNPSVLTYYRVRIESGGTVTYSNVVSVNPFPDACANALSITSLPYTSALISNACATDDVPASTCDGPYKNIWWKYTPASCGTLTAITCVGGTNFDDEISVFTGTCGGTMTQVACNDDAGAGCTGTFAGVSWTGIAGTTYYISVGSYSSTSATGNIQLNVTSAGIPPALVAGTAGTDATICTGGDPSANLNTGAASGGIGTITYQWQQTTVAGCASGWAAATAGTGNNTSVDFDPPALTTTTCYRRVATDACSQTATTGTVTITVVADPVWATNTITPSSGGSICLGGGVTFSATTSGGSGGSVSWVRATTPGGAGTTVTSGDVPSTTGTFYYRPVYTASVNGCNLADGTERTINVIADPTWASNSVTPTAICNGGTITLAGTISGGLGGSISWIRATAPNGAGTTVVSGDAPPAGGPYYYRPTYTATGTGCNAADGAETTVTLFADPTAPTLASANPASGSSLCIGSTILPANVTFNTFTNGTGTCTNEYQYTVNGGANWLTYTPGSTTITAAGAGTNMIQIQSRRVCDGNGCDGSGETFATIAQWSVIANLPTPTVSGTSNPTLSGCGLVTLIPDPSTGNTFKYFNAVPPSGYLNAGPSYAITSSGTYYITTYNLTTGCESPTYATATVTVTPSFAVSVATTPVDCYNGSNGTATVSLSSSGTAPYTFSWTGGSAGGTGFGIARTGFSAGSYALVVSDAGACQTLATFTITQPTAPITFAAPTVSSSTVGGYNMNCNGGTATISNINVSGGNGGYTYAWSPNVSTGSSASGLSIGTYNVTVTDNRGCTGSTSVAITQPNPVTYSAGVGYNCGGSVYVSCTVTVNGAGGQQSGTYPYTYSFNGGAFSTTNTFTQGSNATVSFTVRDGNGCTTSGTLTPTKVGTAVTATDACNAIFVSRVGSASESGTKTCPTTLVNAISLLSNSRNKIIMEGGTYSLTIAQTLVLPSSVSNIIIDGGYTISGTGSNTVWTKQSNNATVFTIDPPEVSGGTNIGHKIGINATNCSGFTISDIRFNVTGISTITKVSGTNITAATGYGKSVYGLYLSGCSNYTVTRCVITTGNASAGSNGTAGTTGAVGNNGANGGSGSDNDETQCYAQAAGGTGCNAGGIGGPNACNSRGSGTGGTGGGGGGAGGNGGGNACSFIGCSNPGNGTAGGGGSVGANGAIGSPNNAAGTQSTFFVPGAVGGTGSTGNDGSGGGGGGGGGREVGTWCNDGAGGGGGGGGAGGCGGTGGTGGFGGGSSYAIYLWNNGTGGNILDYSLTPGAAGAGGTGGAGGSGGAGGNGGAGGSAGCNVGTGGNGGNGGAGGVGGTGGAGAAGESVAIKLGSGTAATTNGSALPTAADPVTVDQDQGCTNSVITITKNGGGNWTLPAGATIINDLNSTTASTSTSSNTAYITYASIPGTPNPQDLVTASGGTYRNYVNVRFDRTLPTFTVSNTGPCANTPVTLTVTNNGSNPTGDPVTYEWAIISGTTPSTPSSGVSNAVTTTHTFTAPGTYQVRLRVKVSCCGWSAPLYQTVTVVNAPTTPTIPVGTSTLCELSTGIGYTTSSTNATAYTWTINGGTVATGGTTNSPTVNWAAYSATANISVVASNTCGTSASSPVLTINLKKRPTAIAVPSTNPATFCGNTGNLVLNGGATQNTPGGNNTFTYSWSTGGTTQNINITNSTSSATYTLTVTEGGSSCISLPVSVNVTVNPNPVAPTFSAGATSLCANGTSTYTATSTSGTVTYSIIGGTGASINSTTGVLSSAGTANFTVRATATTTSCGTAFTDRAVTVNPNPVAPTFTAGPTTLCTGATATYTATSTGGTVTYSIIGGSGAAINSTTGALSSAGTANFTVRATATTGSCGALFTDRAVTITPTTVAPTFTAGSTILCANATDTYTATTTAGTVTYSVVGGSGASINATTGVLTSAGTANFTVRATSTGTCSGPFFTDRAVTVRSMPTAAVTVTGTNPICESSSSTVRFTGINGTTINYTLNGSPASVNITSGGFADVATGTLSANAVYAVTGASYTDNTPGCSSTPSSTATVTVQSGPQQRFVYAASTTVCSGTSGTIQLINSESGTVYQLYNTTDGANVGPTQTGTGATLNFSTGAMTGDKSFKIIASRTPCASLDMNNFNDVDIYVVSNGYWKGAVSTDWFDSGNWCLGGGVPTSSTNIVIPNIATTNFDAVINASGAVCNTISINTGGILSISGTNNLNVYGDWNNSGTFNYNTSTVTFKGTGTTNIGGFTDPQEFNNLKVDKGTSVTSILDIGVNTTVHGSLQPTNGLASLSSGDLTLSNATTIASTAGVEIGGNLVAGALAMNNNGLFRVLSGANADLGSLTNGSGSTYTVSGGVSTVAGNVSNTGTTVSNTGGTISVGGNWTNASSSTVTYGGSTISVTGDYSSTGSTVNANSATVAIGGSYTNATSTLSLGGAIVSVGKYLNSTSGTLNQTGGALTLNTLGGTYNSNAVLNLDATSNMNISSGTMYFERANVGTGNDLVISAGGTKTITGGTFQFGTGNTQSGEVFKVNNNAVDFNNLTVFGTNSPTVQLLSNAATRSAGVLTVNGVLDLNGNTFTVKNGAISSISATGYVLSESTNANSKLAWNIGNSTGAYVFPFGTSAGTQIPFTFNVTTAGVQNGTGNVTISTYPTADNNIPWIGGVAHMDFEVSGLDGTAATLDRWWLIDANNYTTKPVSTMTFKYADGDLAGNNSLTESNLKAQRWNGGGWDGPTLFGGNNSANAATNTVTISNVSNYSPWVLHDGTSLGNSPLPIELVDFKAACNSDEVTINWTTATEVNNDYFTVQRSIDLTTFDNIAVVEGAGNSNVYRNYTAKDQYPISGTSYYRLMQTDYNGQFEVFDPVAVVCVANGSDVISIFPNPTTDKLNITMNLSAADRGRIMIYNPFGQLVTSQFVEPAAGFNTYSFDLGNLAQGQYMVSFMMENKVLPTQRVIVSR